MLGQRTQACTEAPTAGANRKCMGCLALGASSMCAHTKLLASWSRTLLRGIMPSFVSPPPFLTSKPTLAPKALPLSKVALPCNAPFVFCSPSGPPFSSSVVPLISQSRTGGGCCPTPLSFSPSPCLPFGLPLCPRPCLPPVGRRTPFLHRALPGKQSNLLAPSCNLFATFLHRTLPGRQSNLLENTSSQLLAPCLSYKGSPH